MANFLVRNLDDHVLKGLKAAAKAHGRSLQTEIHEVLRVDEYDGAAPLVHFLRGQDTSAKGTLIRRALELTPAKSAHGEPFDSLALSLSKGELAQDVLVEP